MGSNSNSSSKRTGSTKSNSKVAVVIGWILSVIQLLASGVLTYFILKINVLGLFYTALAIAGLILLLALTRWLMWKSRPTGRYVVGVIISVLISAACVIGSYYLYTMSQTIKSVTTDEEYATIGVYVLKDDKANSIVEAEEYTFGYANMDNDDTIPNAINEINKDIKSKDSSFAGEIKTVDDNEIFSLASDLKKQTKIQAMIMDESFMEIVAETEGYENFPNEVKEIASYKISKKTEKSNRRDIFNLYISGIDTDGKVSKTSRSDVNIIACVNRNTHQILLISTPRDYYVPLSVSKGEGDKLTHAGLYGINCSMDTLEALYDVPLDYYFRLNFSGFKDIIDALGGIDVESPKAFTTANGNFKISEGTNHLNGSQALAFARERVAFNDGDNQRGRDQMTIVKAAFKKMASPAILGNFSEIMKGLEGSFQTNVPDDLISEVAQGQISDGLDWDIQSYSVEGTGAKKKTYSVPNADVYVCVPNQASVDKAKEYIKQISNNRTVKVEEKTK